jgi:CHAT domain-containing protein/cytochrome c-type biogenesis protein CcmH/NrfG
LESHLNDDEIEEILRFAPDWKDKPVANRGDDNALLHLKTCEICQTRVGAEKAAMDRLVQLKPRSIQTRSSQCPPDDIWIEIAAGTMSQDLDDYSTHAAQCDHCGPLLTQAFADFAAELTPEEEAQIAALASSSDEWQRSLAGRMSRLVTEEPVEQSTVSAKQLLRAQRSANRWMHWTFAPTAFAVILIAAVVLWRSERLSSSPQSDLPSANKLLAQSYSEQRTLAFRFPAAAYAPLGSTRGARESDLDRPMALLQAEATIKASLQKYPDDSGWLDARGRADLLQWNFSSAIKTLKKALAISPDSTAIQLDLATAYFESGKSGGGSDYAHSIELLTLIVKREPNNLIARFNLALACQSQGDYDCAKDNWKRYLQLDPNGAWANEASEHLAEALKDTEGRSQRDSEPLLTEGQFEASIKMDQEDTWKGVNSRIEDYLERALVEWVQSLSGSPPQNDLRSSNPYNAARNLGMILERRHRDRFLLDLLRGIGDPNFPAAMGLLRGSILANEHGNQGIALAKAQEGEGLFRKTGNTAGVLISRFEQVYAMQFLVNAPRCLSISANSGVAASLHGYSWLATQFLIEEAFCSNIAGNPGRARSFASKAADEANGAHYDDLYLRAMVGLAAIDSQSGSMPHAWSLTSEGLRLFWSGQGSPTRGYSFFVLQDALAEADQLWQFDTVVVNEALRFMPQVSDPLVEAAIRYRSAEAYMRVGAPRLAEEQLRVAQDLLDRAPKTDSNIHERITGIIEIAKIEDDQGRPAQSIKFLEQAGRAAEDDYEVFDSLEYFITLGESDRKLGHLQSAKAAYLSAIKVCEMGAGTLKSARDRLSWIRTCRVPYYSLVKLQFKQGSTEDAFFTYQRFRRVTMNTLSAIEQTDSTSLARTDFRVRANSRERRTDSTVWNMRDSGDSKIAVLTYATFDDGVLAWIHDNRGSNAQWVEIPKPELSYIATRFLAECEEPSSDANDVRRDAKELYHLLLSPFQVALGSSQQLVIEPDSPVANIPFEALVDQADRFLGERFSLLISPGGNRSNSRSSGVPLVNQPALILDADYSDTKNGFMPLESTKQEAQKIGDLLQKPSYLIGAAATQPAMEKYLPRVSIFHYLGHSQTELGGNSLFLRTYQQGDPKGPSAVSWGAANISPILFHRCKLAVLSACSTANGEQGEWLDRESLVFALIAAGVPKVVASHWDVDSKTTSVMMEAFYRHLRDGGDVSAALQQAQAEVRRNSVTSHPFYWAAFSVFGTP